MCASPINRITSDKTFYVSHIVFFSSDCSRYVAVHKAPIIRQFYYETLRYILILSVTCDVVDAVIYYTHM